MFHTSIFFSFRDSFSTGDRADTPTAHVGDAP
jgi:hypothetical protein